MSDGDSSLDVGQDVGFRVADELSAQIRARADAGTQRQKSVVTTAIRRGLQEMRKESAPTLRQRAIDAGFTQYHAQLTTAEIAHLNSLCDRIQVEGKRKVPMRFVLRECLVRGLDRND